MAVQKITEKPRALSVGENLHVLITQDENVNGEPAHALRRMPADVFRLGALNGCAGALLETADGSTIDIAADWRRGAPLELLVYGATSQPGEGAPTPDNVRPIRGIGNFDAAITVDGSESWTMTRGSSAVYFTASLSGALPSNSSTTGVAGLQLASWGEIGNATAAYDLCYVAQSGENVRVRVSRTGIDSVEALKAYLTQNPLTIWYQSTNFAAAREIYVGVKATDADGSRAIAAGPMAPLFDGDVLNMLTGEVSRAKDFMLLDGDGDAVFLASGAKRTVNAYGEGAAAPGVCSHYSVTVGTPGVNYIKRRDDARVAVAVDTDAEAGYPNTEEGVQKYNAYLAAQAAAGTPVIAVFDRTAPAASVVPVSGQLAYAGDARIACEGDMSLTYAGSITNLGLIADAQGRLCVTIDDE